MKNLTTFLALPCLLLLPAPAPAQWPTSLRQNLPIAADSTLVEVDPAALSYPNGGILTAFHKAGTGLCFQITTRYGEPTFTPFASPAPATSLNNAGSCKLAPDGAGGAYLAWLNYTPGYYGLWAQRLDSAGNRLWGDAAVRVNDYWPTASYFGICPDGVGGLILAYHNWDSLSLDAQRVSPGGQLCWGPGVAVCQLPGDRMDPRPAHDGAGGAYVVWQDFRPPYGGQGAPFMQKLDSLGQICWAENGILAHNGTPIVFQPIADGEGGLLLLTGTGLPNYVYRYNAAGDTLWRRMGVCTWVAAQIHLAEPGYFYLGWEWNGHYAQRMDLDGNTYWPTFGSLAGIPLVATPGLSPVGGDFAYQFPFFYAVLKFEAPGNDNRVLYAQVVDAGMRRHLGRGVLMTATPPPIAGGGIDNLNAVPDGRGGMAAVWERNNGSTIHDIYAKHVNADGSLGGAIPAPGGAKPAEPPTRSVENLSVRGGAINYALLQASAVKLELFDILGRKVAVLQNEFQTAGPHVAAWEKKNLPSGIYLLMLSTSDDRQIVKIAIVQ